MNFILYYLKRAYDVFVSPIKAFNNCKPYLKAGQYKIAPNYTVIFSDANSKIKTFSGSTEIKDEINDSRTILRRILSKRKYKLSNNNNVFNGSLLIISSSGKQYKILDTENRLVLTKYNQREQYIKCINNYNYLKKIYNIPEILEKNDRYLYTIEKMIEAKEKDFNIIFEYLIERAINNFAKFKKCNKNDLERKEANSNYKIYNYLKKDYRKISKDISVIKCHGDMWDANIIYDGKNYNIIDMESVNYFILYYDIFFYMFTESYLSNNDVILNKYFKGNYDSLLEELFSKFECNYDKNCRVEYFNTFLYEYINNKKINFNSYTGKKEYNRLKIFLKKYKLLGDKSE